MPPSARRCSTLAGGELVQCVQREGGISHLAPAGGDGHGATAPASDAAAGGEAVAPLEVIYEDDYMACVVKPPGVPTDAPPGRSSQGGGGGSGSSAQPSDSASQSAGSQAGAAGQRADGVGGSEASSPRAPPPAAPSVYSRLPRSLAPSRQLGALRRPRHCHRLDEPTGGLLLVGKTRRAQAALCGAFQDRRVRASVLLWGGVLCWVLGWVVWCGG